MLVTFSVVDTSSVFVFNRKLTFAKDDLTLNEFLISKNVSFNTIVENKVGSSMNSLCSVELSCINDILISDQCIPGTCIFYNSRKKRFSMHLADFLIILNFYIQIFLFIFSKCWLDVFFIFEVFFKIFIASNKIIDCKISKQLKFLTFEQNDQIFKNIHKLIFCLTFLCIAYLFGTFFWASFEGQNIIWIFSTLSVSIF